MAAGSDCGWNTSTGRRRAPVPTNPSLSDLGGGGLRFQGKGARVRPFFDVGFVAGAEQRDRAFLPFGQAC